MMTRAVLLPAKEIFVQIQLPEILQMYDQFWPKEITPKITPESGFSKLSVVSVFLSWFYSSEWKPITLEIFNFFKTLNFLCQALKCFS